MQAIESDKEIFIVTSEGDPGSPTTLFDFIETNNRKQFGPFIFTEEQLSFMRSLEIGQAYIFDMGPGGLFKVTRQVGV